MSSKPLVTGIIILVVGLCGSLVYYYTQQSKSAGQRGMPMGGDPSLQAADAERMADDHYSLTEAQRTRRLKELNRRLAREAAAREAAESSMDELDRTIEMLEAKLAESLERQRILLARQSGTGEYSQDELDAATAAIQAHRNSLSELREKRSRLKVAREDAINRQIELENKIFKVGGKITIPDYDVWSPDYRRYDMHRFGSDRIDLIQEEAN